MKVGNTTWNLAPMTSVFRKVDTTEQLLEGDVFYFTCIHDGSFLKPMYEYLEETTDYVIGFFNRSCTGRNTGWRSCHEEFPRRRQFWS